jgi:hypothetical protein
MISTQGDQVAGLNSVKNVGTDFLCIEEISS